MSDNPVDTVAKLLDPHYGTLEATKMMMRMEAAQIIETLRKPPHGPRNLANRQGH